MSNRATILLLALAVALSGAAIAEDEKVVVNNENSTTIEAPEYTAVQYWCYAGGVLTDSGVGYNYTIRPNGTTVIYVEQWGGPVTLVFSPAFACSLKVIP